MFIKKGNLNVSQKGQPECPTKKITVMNYLPFLALSGVASRLLRPDRVGVGASRVGEGWLIRALSL